MPVMTRKSQRDAALSATSAPIPPPPPPPAPAPASVPKPKKGTKKTAAKKVPKGKKKKSVAAESSEPAPAPIPAQAGPSNAPPPPPPQQATASKARKRKEREDTEDTIVVDVPAGPRPAAKRAKFAPPIPVIDNPDVTVERGGDETVELYVYDPIPTTAPAKASLPPAYYFKPFFLRDDFVPLPEEEIVAAVPGKRVWDEAEKEFVDEYLEKMSKYWDVAEKKSKY